MRFRIIRHRVHENISIENTDGHELRLHSGQFGTLDSRCWLVLRHLGRETQYDVQYRHLTGPVIHPECEEEVVNASDYDGSTSFIVNFVEKAPAGSVSVVGTEINLVSRLARNNTNKQVVPLARSLCPNMWKISLNDLLYTLDNLGRVNKVEVNEEIKINARKALKKMLEITGR